MHMEIEKLIALALIAALFTVSLVAYPSLPETVASHWGLEGEVNGYLPAFWGAFLIPILSTALFVIFLAVPSIDPLKANMDAFRTDYHRFILVVTLFLSLVHVQALLWNLGTEVSFNLTMPILMGGLFIYIGDLLGKVKRNWFIGIRTPWTMSSDIVWDKTHKVGGKLFKAAGIASMASILFPAYVYWIVIVGVISAALAAVIYSYVIFSGLAKKQPIKRKA